MIQQPDSLKIAIAIASRGRPAALAGAVMAAWKLQSARHHLAFPIAVDEDDAATLAMIETLKAEGIPAVPVVAPQSPYLAAAQNRAIAAAQDADITTLLTDRTMVISPGWDIGIVDAAIKYPNRVMFWSCPSDPDTTVPIIPHTILERTDWRPLPELWVYWYSDTWLTEVDRMCFGGPSLRVRPMYSGSRQQTQRGRDFAFWTQLFVATRPMRIAAAKKLNADLGLEWKDPPPEMIEDFLARDKHLLDHAEDFQRMFGDNRPPSEQYLEAKAKAEAMMKELAA